MRKLQFKPFIVFNSGTDTGVDEIPLNSYVHIIDIAGSTKLVKFISASGLTGVSTIADMVEDTNYTTITTDGISPSVASELSLDTTPQLAGTLDGAGNQIQNYVLDNYEDSFLYVLASSSTFNLDCNLKHTAVTMTVDSTMSFTNVPTGYCEVIIELKDNNNTITYPSNIFWEGGVTPNGGHDAVNLYKFVTNDGGGTWYGSKVVDTQSSWNIINTTYDSKSYNFSAQEATTGSIEFSTDGTKMYVVGSTAYTVFQYTLSTPWDVSTASYASKSVYVNRGTNYTFGLFFKSDGTRMYVSEYNVDRIASWTLSTPWDVSTATDDSKTFLFGTQDSNSMDISFNPDGTKLFMLGSSNDAVYQYTLSTPWDVTTASYDSVSYSVVGQETGVGGLFFKADGTKMYITGFSSDKIHQYTLGIPWNISSVVYDTGFSVATQTGGPRDIYFNNSGAIYVSDSTTVYQYSIN